MRLSEGRLDRADSSPVAVSGTLWSCILFYFNSRVWPVSGLASHWDNETYGEERMSRSHPPRTFSHPQLGRTPGSGAAAQGDGGLFSRPPPPTETGVRGAGLEKTHRIVLGRLAMITRFFAR